MASHFNSCGSGFVAASDWCLHVYMFACDGWLGVCALVLNAQKPFACTTCGQSFAQRGNLTKHHRVHSGEKPFACDRCNARFGQSSSLTRHQQIHDRQSSDSSTARAAVVAACPECAAEFGNEADLSRHLTAHIDTSDAALLLLGPIRRVEK